MIPLRKDIREKAASILVFSAIWLGVTISFFQLV